MTGVQGASWGMDFEGEAELEALQRRLDIEEDEQARAEGEEIGLSDSDEETIRVLDTEKLKLKSASLSEKQTCNKTCFECWG